jgi:two-component system, cell cycle sensor histidine kinase and response regulator CckA
MENELELLRQKLAKLEAFKVKYEQLGESLQQSPEWNALKKSEGKYRALVENSLQGLSIIQDGRFIFCNDAFAAMTGYSVEELLAFPLSINLVHPEDQATVQNQRQNRLAGGLDPTSHFHRIIKKDGSLRWMEIYSNTIEFNGRFAIQVAHIDITERRQAEIVLQRSEEQFRSLVETANDWVWQINSDGIYTYVSPKVQDLLGYKVEEVIGKTPFDFMPREESARVSLLFQNFMKSHKPFSGIENVNLHIDGREIVLETNGVPILDNDGNLLSYHGIDRDVTAHKQAEAALRQSEKLLSDILDGSPFAQMVIGKDHRIIKWNRALEKYSGIRANDVVGTDLHWSSCFNEKRPLLVDWLVDDAVEKIPQLYAGKYTKSKLVDGAYEVTDFYPKAGENGKWLLTTASAIKDSDGNIVGAMSIVEDVTEKKRVEEELRESREYLAQIINQISDPIFVKDSEHKYVLVNDAMCEFVGRPREQLLGRDSFDEHHDDLAASLIEREAEVFRTGKENTSEDTILDRKEKTHTLLAKKALLVDKKGNRQIVGVLRDITERKHLEAQFLQAQKMEAVGALAGGVAHDFNNLLNVINGYCELALEDLAEDNPLREDILQISQAGTRAKSLTSQLLAFSRKQILQPVILDLNEAIEDAQVILRRLIPENIDLVMSAQSELGLIYADPGQIQQVLMNLVVNARDAMPEGGKLTIETANVDFNEEYIQSHSMAKAGSYVMMAISDNGIGMNEETQAHLFEPFFTTKEKGKGTGLGLSTVYGIVKQSNGFIWVYSEPGHGATFKVYFPCVEGKASTVKKEVESDEMVHGIETVIVAEDEPAVRRLAARVLRERGYTILEASNGQEALEIARAYAGEILLVITDIIMPGMNGKDLVTQLQKMRPRIKALYISGYTNNAIVHHGILNSEIAFLQKPFTVRSLARKVREVLDS